jgi:predicted metal-binding protein
MKPESNRGVVAVNLIIAVIVVVLSSLSGTGDPAVAVATAAPAAAAEPAAAAAGAKNPWVEPARDVLAHATCGGCHRPGLPTTNARALKIFNLNDPVWYAAMTDDQLRSLRTRIEHSPKLEESDQNQVIAFVNCKLDGACDPSRAKESP